MSYTWHFYTGSPGFTPEPRHCYRGPMIDVETVMSAPFVYMSQHNTLRKRLLDNIVNDTYQQAPIQSALAVQTREVVLRVLKTSLGPIFARLTPRKKSLQADICEKRSSTVIEDALGDVTPVYTQALQSLQPFNVPVQQIELLRAALESQSPVLRVAGKCATVLLISYIEMDYYHG